MGATCTGRWMVDVAEACGALMISMIDLRVARARAIVGLPSNLVGLQSNRGLYRQAGMNEG